MASIAWLTPNATRSMMPRRPFFTGSINFKAAMSALGHSRHLPAAGMSA